jgi:predicted nuclease with RNAse H fold
MTAKKNPLIVAGIDVGGKRKGFHAVALRNGAFHDKFHSTDAKEIADWCRKTVQARVIGIDAPCRWSLTGRARPAERELIGEGIWCFSTPDLRTAKNHPTNHYGWMLNGAELFRAMEKTHPIRRKSSGDVGLTQCFETFPHAVACGLSGHPVSAKDKRRIRRALLEEAGIDTTELTNIDLVDAALCALTAHFVASWKACKSYGEPKTGLIIVPASL